MDFNVKQGNEQEALQLIRKIYPYSSPEVHQQMYNAKRLEHLNKIAARGNTQDSVWKALTDKNHRGSSFICLALSIFNNLSGQSVICIYSTAIFEMMTSRGAISRYQVKQENSFIGYTAVIGAMLSYFTVSYFSRRVLFIGGHFIMGVLMFLTGYCVQTKQHDPALSCILMFILIFQCTQGSALFVYIAEVSDSDSVMGMCLFVLMFGLTVQSMFTTCLLNSKLGVVGMFFVLGFVQVAAFTFLNFFMKETNGLTPSEKKQLYAAVEEEPIESKNPEN